MFFLKFAHRCEHLIFLSDSVIQILLKVFNLFLHSVCLSFEHIFLEFSFFVEHSLLGVQVLYVFIEGVDGASWASELGIFLG